MREIDLFFISLALCQPKVTSSKEGKCFFGNYNVYTNHHSYHERAATGRVPNFWGLVLVSVTRRTNISHGDFPCTL
jgi:hypothetical protein